MTQVQVKVGDQVFAAEGGEELGAVRLVMPHELIIYIENGGEFSVPARAVATVHDGKVVLDLSQVDERLRAAVKHAHDRETE